MKIQNQVCTLEQAKKLSKLGINGSYFSYQGSVDYEPDLKSDDGLDYPAFTVGELGAMIDWNHLCISPPYRNNGNWVLHTNDDDFFDMKEAVVRADALIWQIENKLITPEAVNQRLIL